MESLTDQDFAKMKKKKTIKKSGNKIKIKILQKRSVLFTALWNNKRKKINLFII